MRVSHALFVAGLLALVAAPAHSDTVSRAAEGIAIYRQAAVHCGYVEVPTAGPALDELRRRNPASAGAGIDAGLALFARMKKTGKACEMVGRMKAEFERSIAGLASEAPAALISPSGGATTR